jgi:hypothetical protein
VRRRPRPVDRRRVQGRICVFAGKRFQLNFMITRRLWKCPRCGRRWEIPAEVDPKGCPKCVPAACDSPSADLGKRDFQSFFAPFVREDSTSAQGRADRAVHDVEQPASERAFFIPLATESYALDAATAEEPVVFRKRKQRSQVPLVAVVACVAGCVLIVGLIVYQKTKGRTAAAIAIKTTVEGHLERPESAASPSMAGTRDGRTESAVGRDHKNPLGVGKGRPGTGPSEEDNDVAGETPSSP